MSRTDWSRRARTDARTVALTVKFSQDELESLKAEAASRDIALPALVRGRCLDCPKEFNE